MNLSALPTVSVVSQAQGAGALPDATEKTEKAARQFEGLLMSMLFQGMRKTIQPSGLFGDSGSSRSTYEYLMDQAVVDRAVAGGRGWGLAEKLQAAWTQAGTKPVAPGGTEPQPEKKGEEM